jgi:hypothetical protein
MEFNKSFIEEIKALVLQGREQAIRAVDHTRVLLYWNIGKRIFEEEQAGKDRADYGSFLIKHLSDVLQPEFGSGFSYRQLIGIDNFTAHSQLCPHCGHNLAGCTISYYYLLIIKTRKNIMSLRPRKTIGLAVNLNGK